MRSEHWFYTVPLRLRSLFRRRRADSDLDAELRDHLEQKIAHYISNGLTPEDARRIALLELGGIEQAKEKCRDTRRTNWLHDLAQDVRYGLRILRKSPGFTAVAVLTLALGIGANAAIFSIVEWLVIRPLPIHNPEQVMFLAFPTRGANFDGNFSAPEFDDIRKQTSSVFSSVSAVLVGGAGGQGPAALMLNGRSAPIVTTYVIGNYFDFLGLKPYAGRFILPSEGKTAGADPVVVLSYRYWQSRFHGDLSIVGKPVFINGHPVTIIGIAPKGFLGVTPIFDMEAYLPLGMASLEIRNANFLADANARLLFLVMGRLRDGVTIAQANATLRVIGKRLMKKYPRRDESDALRAMPLRPPGIINGDNPMPKVAALFLLLATLVLGLACLNVANLVLVRSANRYREMGVRAVLGAGRQRLIRQLLMESLLLAILGCIGGIIAGKFASQSMSLTNFQTQAPIVLDFQFDWRVFAYTFAIALLTAVLVGITPALRATTGNLSRILHDGGRTGTDRRQRFRRWVAAGQVAGSVTLLVVAGLFIRSLMGVAHTDLGFHPAQVLNVTVDPAGAGYSNAQGAAFYRLLLDRARALPGVQSASLTWLVPLGDDYFSDTLTIPGYQVSKGEPPSAGFNSVSPDYFKTMGIATIAGRDFISADNENAPRVAIINQAMADRFWRGQNPLGKQFRRGDSKLSLQVVGVVQNSRVVDLYSPYDPFFYIPLAQNSVSFATLQLRTAGPPTAEAQAVESLIQNLGLAVPFYGVRTMKESLNGANGLLFFNIGAVLTGGLGLLGLVLATVGVYGVMSYSVSQRTHEIGIRMALGAQHRQIFRMVGRQGLFMIGVGLAAGLLAAFGIGRLIGALLVGVGSADPVTYGGVAVILGAVALLACYIPARRAMRVDPMVALRHE